MKKIAITVITFISITYSANNNPYITKLTLSLPKKEINKDSTIEAKVTVTYSNNTTKELSKNIEWVVSKKDALKIKNTKLTALKDYPTPITIEAKVKNSINKIVTSNKENLKIYWEVDGHRLPPEPDPKINNSTLLGVDVNKNGVRDDVERWIYEKYKDKHPIHIDIAMQAARGYKLVLEHPEKAKEIYAEVDKTAYCEGYFRVCVTKSIKNKFSLERITTANYFIKKIFNTKTRWKAYILYDTLLSGDSYAIPRCNKAIQLCDFNTSKYKE